MFRDQKGVGCYNYIKEHCIKNKFNGDVCRTWCAQNKEECNKYMSDRCNDQWSDHVGCIEWCMQNHGKCDEMMMRWCKANPTDPKCSCILSDVQQYQHNPVCIDRKCIDHGYQTSSMISSRGNGCKIVDCNTYLNIKSKGQVQIDDVNLDQQCGSQEVTQALQMKDSSLWMIVGILSFMVLIWTMWIA
jgi:hypothetical protein